jgi:hypothetical protein
MRLQFDRFSIADRSTDVHGLVWNLQQPSGNKMECNHEHHRQSVEREPQLFEEAR